MESSSKKADKAEKPEQSKKLSKAGMWLRSNKPGVGVIVDMKAVLK